MMIPHLSIEAQIAAAFHAISPWAGIILVLGLIVMGIGASNFKV